MDQFDKNLKTQILKAFENLEVPSADEGWLQLREKFPEKKERRPAAWLLWSAAAAVLLMFFYIAVLTNYNKDKPKKFAYKHTQLQHNIVLNKIDTAVKSSKAGDYNYPAGDNKSNAISKNLVGQSNGDNIINHNTSAVNKSSVNSEQILANNQPVVQKANDSSGVKLGEKLTKQSVVTHETSVLETNTNSNNNFIKNPDKPKPSIFDDDMKYKNTVQVKQSDNKKVSFSIYAATFVNYAKGSSNQLNAGVGFTSDISITKNLKFSTGVILAQNSLNYSTAPLKEPEGNDLSYISPSTQTAYTMVSTKGVVPNLGLSSASPVFKNYNASLVGLDVPLNLKYEFDPQKSATYVSAGVSSGTFLNETYTYSYLNALSQQTQDASTHSNFGNFYFAKTLNFSFGVGYPLGKSNLLIIEPFVKYPIDGLGAEQIRFGAGGVNFKFNFNSAHK